MLPVSFGIPRSRNDSLLDLLCFVVAQTQILMQCDVQVKGKVAADVEGFASAAINNVAALITNQVDKSLQEQQSAVERQDAQKKALDKAQATHARLQTELQECEKADKLLAESWNLEGR